MVPALVFFAVLSILIVVHEFGHFMVAKKTGVRVEKFSLGFGKCLMRKKKGDTEYSLSAIPLGGYVKLAGDSIEECQGRQFEYYSKPILQRALIIFFGPLLNYLLGFLVFWLIFIIGFPSLTTKVGSLMPGFGAEEAGIKPGDKILAIDGKRIELWEDLQALMYSKKNQPQVQMLLSRDGEVLDLVVKIKEKQFNDSSGRLHKIGLLGVIPDEEAAIILRHGFWESSLLAARRVWSLTMMTYDALARMITGRMSLRDSVTGPLGVFYITSRAAQMGVIPVLFLLAALSISLAIFNLLPLPLLDGGHLALLVVEKIRGRALEAKAEKMITRVGFTMIIALGILVTYNDIVRIFGEKIAKLFK